ncbi:hypothetical protein [Streptomyces sp. NBC_01198]|uniref:hypothetical protein n=1 Tax=Streptomyces sp. NBC_01198 TaxID=2903769 RepID=UPI002E10D751|nr:hypothetical protein OG702_00315 [Streptomyces sp. NBC_01198]
MKMRDLNILSLVMTVIIVICACITFGITDDAWVEGLSAGTALLALLGGWRELRATRR